MSQSPCRTPLLKAPKPSIQTQIPSDEPENGLLWKGNSGCHCHFTLIASSGLTPKIHLPVAAATRQNIIKLNEEKLNVIPLKPGSRQEQIISGQHGS